MRRLLSGVASRTADGLLSISNKLRKRSLEAGVNGKAQEDAFQSWFRDQGDKTLRLDYDLNESSIVFDLGGYEGQWASDIFSMYCCFIHVFEPIQDFVARIDQRFSRNTKIITHRFGLSGETRDVRIGLGRDGSSTFKNGTDTREITLIKATDFMRENSISDIDLMKINIEGGEYELLEHLIETEYVAKIKNLQVQFHDFVPDAEQRMARIRADLERTHFLTYEYRFVWENWRLRSIAP